MYDSLIQLYGTFEDDMSMMLFICTAIFAYDWCVHGDAAPER